MPKMIARLTCAWLEASSLLAGEVEVGSAATPWCEEVLTLATSCDMSLELRVIG